MVTNNEHNKKKKENEQYTELYTDPFSQVLILDTILTKRCYSATSIMGKRE